MSQKGGRPRRGRSKRRKKKVYDIEQRSRPLVYLPKMGDFKNGGVDVNKQLNEGLNVDLLAEDSVENSGELEERKIEKRVVKRGKKKRKRSGTKHGISPEMKKQNMTGNVIVLDADVLVEESYDDDEDDDEDDEEEIEEGAGTRSDEVDSEEFVSNRTRAKLKASSALKGDKPESEVNNNTMNSQSVVSNTQGKPVEEVVTPKQPLPPLSFETESRRPNSGGSQGSEKESGILGRWYNKVFGSSPIASGSELAGLKDMESKVLQDSSIGDQSDFSDNESVFDDGKDDDLDELDEKERGLARVLRRVMRTEHRKLEKRIGKIEKGIKSESSKNFTKFVEFLQENYEEMENAVEKRLEVKFQKKYDDRINEYEDKVKKLESEVKEVKEKGTKTVVPSREDMQVVRNEILVGLDRSKSVATCLDNMVKQRLERKIDAGTLKVESADVSALKAEVKTLKDQMSRMAGDIEILNPDPFSQEHLCVVCTGLPYTQGEDAVKVALDMLRDLKTVLDREGERFQCQGLRVIGAKRLGSVDHKYPLLKIALASQEQKVAVLRAKSRLSLSDNYYNVRIRTSKSDNARAMEENMLLIRDTVPGLEEYRLTGNSRLVSRDRGRQRGRGGSNESQRRGVSNDSRRRGGSLRGHGSGRDPRGRRSSVATSTQEEADSDSGQQARQGGRGQYGRGGAQNRVRRGRRGGGGRGRGRGAGRSGREEDMEWGGADSANWTDGNNYDNDFPRLNNE